MYCKECGTDTNLVYWRCFFAMNRGNITYLHEIFCQANTFQKASNWFGTEALRLGGNVMTMIVEPLDDIPVVE